MEGLTCRLCLQCQRKNPLEAYLLKASPVDIQKVCVRPLSLRNSEPTRWFSQMTPDEHPRRHHLADGPLSSPPCRWPTLITLTKFELVWRRLCDDVLFRSSCLLSAPSVLPEDRIRRNIIYIRRFCDHINVLHVVDQTCMVLKSCWRSTTGPPDI